MSIIFSVFTVLYVFIDVCAFDSYNKDYLLN